MSKSHFNIKQKFTKILASLLCLLFIFQQTGSAQVAAQLDIAGHLASLRSNLVPDKFRPLHLRYLQYNPQENNFRLLLDKGDVVSPQSTVNSPQIKQFIEENSKKLLEYFLIGLTLPNDSFWVNLRPDSPDNIIDPDLEQTDIGRIMLETDLQLKKDTASMTSPQTPEGREYWNKLYKKTEELFGYENVTIPTLTRPWIVPDEIIVRENADSAYVYKATLKVMLEEDYLTGDRVQGTGYSQYEFKDPRLKALNEYSSQLIRELIIPKLTKQVNSAKRYASLRQVYYSLILAQWFKSRYSRQSTVNSPQNNPYTLLINTRNLNGLTAKEIFSKETYFQGYQNSFKDGEYNIMEPAYTPFGQVVRSYFSGGMDLGSTQAASAQLPAGTRLGKLASWLILATATIGLGGEPQVRAGWAEAQPNQVSANPIANSSDSNSSQQQSLSAATINGLINSYLTGTLMQRIEVETKLWKLRQMSDINVLMARLQATKDIEQQVNLLNVIGEVAYQLTRENRGIVAQQLSGMLMKENDPRGITALVRNLTKCAHSAASSALVLKLQEFPNEPNIGGFILKALRQCGIPEARIPNMLTMMGNVSDTGLFLQYVNVISIYASQEVKNTIYPKIFSKIKQWRSDNHAVIVQVRSSFESIHQIVPLLKKEYEHSIVYYPHPEEKIAPSKKHFLLVIVDGAPQLTLYDDNPARDEVYRGEELIEKKLRELGPIGGKGKVVIEYGTKESYKNHCPSDADSNFGTVGHTHPIDFPQPMPGSGDRTYWQNQYPLQKEDVHGGNMNQNQEDDSASPEKPLPRSSIEKEVPSIAKADPGIAGDISVAASIPRAIQDFSGYQLVSDADSKMEAIVFQATEVQHLPTITEIIEALREDVKIIILINSNDIAIRLRQSLAARNTPGLLQRINFIKVPQPLISPFARDPCFVLYNPKTKAYTWFIPKDGGYSQKRPDRTAARALMNQGIRLDEFYRNNVNDATIDIDGGDVTSDSSYVFIGRRSIEFSRYNSTREAIISAEEAVSKIQAITGKEVVVLDGPIGHSDLYHLPVGRTKYGEHTSLLGDPAMALEILASLTEQEKEAAIKDIAAALKPIANYSTEAIRDYFELAIRASKAVKHSGGFNAKELEAVKQALEAKGVKVIRVPYLPRGIFPFGIFYPNAILDGKRAIIPQYLIPRLDNTVKGIFTDLGFTETELIMSIILGCKDAGPRCLTQKMGIPQVMQQGHAQELRRLGGSETIPFTNAPLSPMTENSLGDILPKKSQDIQARANVGNASDDIGKDDAGIAGDNSAGFTRREHEEFHDAGKFSAVIASIVGRIRASGRQVESLRLRDGNRTDGYNLRKVVEDYGQEVNGRRVFKVAEGIELRIEADGALVVLNPEFANNHAGRGEYAVYARDEAKVAHELSELRDWAGFAAEKRIASAEDARSGLLGQRLRVWMNENAKNAALIKQKASEFHEKGLEAEFQTRIGEVLDRKNAEVRKVSVPYVDRLRSLVDNLEGAEVEKIGSLSWGRHFYRIVSKNNIGIIVVFDPDEMPGEISFLAVGKEDENFERDGKELTYAIIPVELAIGELIKIREAVLAMGALIKNSRVDYYKKIFFTFPGPFFLRERILHMYKENPLLYYLMNSIDTDKFMGWRPPFDYLVLWKENVNKAAGAANPDGGVCFEISILLDWIDFSELFVHELVHVFLYGKKDRLKKLRPIFSIVKEFVAKKYANKSKENLDAEMITWVMEAIADNKDYVREPSIKITNQMIVGLKRLGLLQDARNPFEAAIEILDQDEEVGFIIASSGLPNGAPSAAAVGQEGGAGLLGEEYEGFIVDAVEIPEVQNSNVRKKLALTPISFGGQSIVAQGLVPDDLYKREIEQGDDDVIDDGTPFRMALGPCIGVIIHNIRTKKTYAAHSSADDLNSIERMLSKVSQDAAFMREPQEVKVIVGGGAFMTLEDEDGDVKSTIERNTLTLTSRKKALELVRKNFTDILRIFPSQPGIDVRLLFSPSESICYSHVIIFGSKTTKIEAYMAQLKEQAEKSALTNKKRKAAVAAEGNEATPLTINTEPKVKEEKIDNFSRSGLKPPESGKAGGIDFRALPIVSQAVTNLSAGMGVVSLERFSRLNLDSEWQEIERLVDSGITPSTERIKEYLQASCFRNQVAQDKDKVILCIAGILRQEEEEYISTEPGLRDILVVLESGIALQKIFIGSKT
ncbi:MAG: hypothetical protein WC628_00845 [Candidatus Omnitrophota bacterium]